MEAITALPPPIPSVPHNGVTHTGYARQGQDSAHNWNTSQEVDGHGEISKTANTPLIHQAKALEQVSCTFQ